MSFMLPPVAVGLLYACLLFYLLVLWRPCEGLALVTGKFRMDVGGLLL